jgi:glucokinase
VAAAPSWSVAAAPSWPGTRAPPAREGSEAVLDAPAEAARAVRAPDATAIGVAAAGVIDPVTGTVTSATDTLHGWAGTAWPPAWPTAPASRWPATTTYAPRRRRNCPRNRPSAGATLVYAAVGTGVGGAVAVGGRVLHGAAGVAGHLGHLPGPEADGLPCTCGATGHLEAIAADPPTPPTTRGGRIATPDQAAEALAAGVHSVVVGTAITAPTALTRAFVAALPA